MSSWTVVWVRPEATPTWPDGNWSTEEFKAARKRAQLHVAPYPVFLGPDGRPDMDLVTFATSGFLGALSESTLETYTVELKGWLNHLNDSARKGWRNASVDDFRNYENWRRRDEDNPGKLIGGATWGKICSAMSCLYDWACPIGLAAVHPVERRPQPRGARPDRAGRGRRGPAAQAPSDVTGNDVRWLTRRAVERWRRVGFEDYGRNGLPRGLERVRTQARNVAFVDLVYGTGMRRQEAGSLLTVEMPQPNDDTAVSPMWLAAKICKFEKARWAYPDRRLLLTVHAYMRYERQQAVRRAQRARRYEGVEPLIVVGISHRGPKSTLTLQAPGSGQTPRRRSLNTLHIRDRMRLFRETDAGLEPLWLWLGDGGLPLPLEQWNGIFDVANARCAREGVPLTVRPHMLRHSFALHLLIQAQNAYLLAPELTWEERTRYQQLFGNVWQLVQAMLGHSDIRTTMDTYLEPVRGLQIETIVRGLAEGGPTADPDEVLRLVGEITGLVIDTPAAASAT